ncbi:hypothetical protein EC973_008533 [Apophysomyces ossiformis]|uniref:NodB homology domain-containing protein n=1 Tax=Apophysomyces ossiformis TaxID=679940 RepID=A0A8H7BWT0_9FUNG|nr:hypothetical protein EC973_008533 [Apophysomyces ossiformis]
MKTVSGLDSLHAAHQRNVLAVSSPVWLANVPTPTNVAKAYPKEENIKVEEVRDHSLLEDIAKYPPAMKQPPTDHPEVQAVVKQLDWSKVPSIAPRKLVNGVFDLARYDYRKDADCWWSASVCRQPKLDYLPEDVYQCPRPGDWGLTFDDGPLRVWSANNTLNQWQEPHLYNFLVENGKQKATLFFIGANVIAYPAAAQRALTDGHTICAHTWSHVQMTALTNEEVVAQFYWTLKAIKQVLGITTRCWRPPFGDVDDRVRAIAWLMGMRTFLWDRDTTDWNLAGYSQGQHTMSKMDMIIKDWLNAHKNGTDDEHGHIVLQHELNNLTVSMAEKWLPAIQKEFNVITPHACMDIALPYWEENFVYPTVSNKSVSTTTTTAKATNPAGNASHSIFASKMVMIHSILSAVATLLLAYAYL